MGNVLSKLPSLRASENRADFAVIENFNFFFLISYFVSSFQFLSHSK
jgi:hypothetical protein